MEATAISCKGSESTSLATSMPHPILSLANKHLGPDFVPKVKQHMIGLAKDFWVDGSENLLGLDFSLSSLSKPKTPAPEPAPLMPPAPASAPSASTAASKPGGPIWRAAPGEISEKMWGDGFVMPAD